MVEYGLVKPTLPSQKQPMEAREMDLPSSTADAARSNREMELPSSVTNPMRTAEPPAVSDYEGLSDGVVNDLLKELGLDHADRVAFLRARLRPPAPAPDAAGTAASIRLNKTAASIPFLNVLHRVFFAKRPSADKIKDTCVFLVRVLGCPYPSPHRCNMLTLVSALMLTVSMEVSLSLNQADFDRILERFASPPYDDCEASGEYLVNGISRFCSTAVTANLSALVVSIAMYLVMEAVDDDDDAILYWARFPTLLVCTLAIWGTADTVSAWKYRHIAMTPNAAVEASGACDTSAWRPDARTTTWPTAALFRDPWGLFERVWCGVYFSSLAAAATCVSWGVRASGAARDDAGPARRPGRAASRRSLKVGGVLRKRLRGLR